MVVFRSPFTRSPHRTPSFVQREDFPGTAAIFTKAAETLRWYLWHGKIQVAGTNLRWLIVDCARLAKYEPVVRDQAQKALARCHDLHSYLVHNMGSLVNYGKRYRRGMPISTSRTEGCVDDIGNARMGKRRRISNLLRLQEMSKHPVVTKVGWSGSIGVTLSMLLPSVTRIDHLFDFSIQVGGEEKYYKSELPVMLPYGRNGPL